jgi:iron complex outermembrane receptor protein
MDDMNLGYTFHDAGRWGAVVRVAFSMQNVFILTGYSGPDPETTSENGIDNTMWPRSRTYSIRLNIKF